MRTREEVLEYGLSFADTYKDSPFHDATYAQVAEAAGDRKMARQRESFRGSLHTKDYRIYTKIYRILIIRGDCHDAQ